MLVASQVASSVVAFSISGGGREMEALNGQGGPLEAYGRTQDIVVGVVVVVVLAVVVLEQTDPFDGDRRFCWLREASGSMEDIRLKPDGFVWRSGRHDERGVRRLREPKFVEVGSSKSDLRIYTCVHQVHTCVPCGNVGKPDRD